MKKVLFSLLLLVMFTSCDNTLTKKYGGTTNIELDPGQRLVNITWKDDNIWYLTRPMEANETPTTFEFKEKSVGGILQGKVIIKESK